VYDDWKQPQLQAEAGKRGLSAGGSNDELKARLEDDDDKQRIAALLGDDEPDTEPPAAGQTPPAAPDPESTGKDAPDPPLKEYTAKFECRGELSTGTHEDNRLRAYDQAVRAGHTPRGGLAAAYRSGFEDVNGVRHAVYKVTLTKQ
jgi:hypothetical protein